jgi:hypothetical protein
LISFFSQQAFAANPACNEISIGTYTIRAIVGNSTIENFSITNLASERFFVDSVNASDSSPNFDVQTNGYDRTILSEGTGTINVKVTGKIYNESQYEKGFIEVRGHFLNGKTCSLQDFGKKTFTVIVEKKPLESTIENFLMPRPENNFGNYCKNIEIFAPSSLEISNNFGQFELAIDNQSDYRATTRIFTKNGSANPSLISVPKKSKITETIEVQAGPGQTEIEYLVESPECSFARKTIVTSMQKESLAKSMAISAKALDTNVTEYELVVSMQNRTGKKIFGNIQINLPDNWKTEGTKEIELGAFETRETIFKLTPEEELKESLIASISFNSNEETIFTQVELKPKEKTGVSMAIGTMFVLLGKNIWIGLLVVFIIIIATLFLLANYSRKQDKIILITKQSEVKA